MITTLFSVSFTSCIDNEVSPVVEAIYEAQADLIAAQAAVQNAEAALLLAQANAVEAQAASDAQVNEDLAAGQLAVLLANAGLTDAQAAAILSAAEGNLAQALAAAGLTDAQAAMILAQVADMEADAEYLAAEREQALLVLVAQTNLDVAEAQNALELAQVQFEIDMAEAVATMEAAGVQLAVGYAYDYMWAMQHANNIMSDLLEAQADLATAQLMQNGSVSWEFYLAQMQGNVATAMANKANLEDAIADLEAYIANPSTPEAIISGLKAQNAAYHDAMEAKEIEMQVQYNAIMALYEQNGVRGDLEDRTFDSLNEHNDAVNEKNDRLDWIETAEGDIEDWELAITNYPAALAAKQLAVTNATTVKNAAVAAQAAAAAAQVTAATNNTNAISALAALNVELSALNLSYQNAIQDLADETALYNAGLPAAQAALVAAQGGLTAGLADLALKQADYNAKKAAFEANPTGFVWTGGTNGAVGLHADATTPTNSYREVNLTDNGVLALSLSAGAGIDMTGTYGTYAAFLVDATAGALAPGDYYNVGGDDVAGGTNADRLELAADALTLAIDAIAPLQTVVDNAQDFLDNFGDDLAAAQLVYNHQKDLYENQLALVATAEALVTSTGITLTAANTALANANTALANANTALANANTALSTFLALPDVAGLQALIAAALQDIADWNQEIAAIQPIIDAKYAVVAGLLGELTAAGVEYTFTIEDDGTGTLEVTNWGVVSSLYPDIHAAIIAEWQVYWTMEQELAALQNAHDLNADLISAYGWSSDDLTDLAGYLADLQNDLANAVYDIEVAEQALAAAQVDEAADEAYIAYYQALIVTLQQRHANTLAIAAKYKALMDAALAS